jgi:hypothetical protein
MQVQFRFGVALFGILLIFSPLVGLSQYHLHEFGFKVGGGSSVPFMRSDEIPFEGLAENQNVAPLYGANLDAYYSYYPCGKSYGFHLELGHRVCGVRETADLNDTFGPFGPERDLKRDLHIGYLNLGAYFKFRKNNFHRDKETAFMVGPKLNIRTFNLQNYEGTSQRFAPEGLRELNRFLPGLYAGAWFRLPLKGTRRHWFVAPGVEIYFLPNARSEFGPQFATLYPHLNLAYTFYNNR